MNVIALFCKSWRADINRVLKQYQSIVKYNVDNIPYYVSVPRTDVDLFRSLINGPLVTILCDDDLYKTNLPGWQSQQIVKCSFWKMGLCKNYLCLDSDQYFIRPFKTSDFIIPDSDICYTVMHEEKDLFSWTIKPKSGLPFNPMESFTKDRLRVMQTFGRSGIAYDFGPTPSIWSCHVWEEMERAWLKKNGITFEDVIKTVPSEFTWYGEFLLATRCIPIMPREPIFKVFHYKGQYLEAIQQDVKESDWAKLYMGICLQSNWNAPIEY